MIFSDNKAHRSGGDASKAGFSGPRNFLEASIQVWVCRQEVILSQADKDRAECGYRLTRILHAAEVQRVQTVVDRGMVALKPAVCYCS